MLHELSLGKFLIGTEIFCGLGNFFCESCCDGNNLLCVLFWLHQKDEDIYNRLFIWEDLTMYPVACVNAQFFQLHYPYKSENGPVLPCGAVDGAWRQQFSRRPEWNIFTPSQAKVTEVLLFGLYLPS